MMMRSGMGNKGHEDEDYFENNYNLDVDHINEVFDSLVEDEGEEIIVDLVREIYMIGFEVGLCTREIQMDLPTIEE